MESNSFQSLTASDLVEIGNWVETNDATLPLNIKAALKNYEYICKMQNASRAKQMQMLLQLQLSMGIIPSSERRNSKDPIGPISLGDKERPKNKKERLKLTFERLNHLSDWHRKLSRKHNQKAKKIKDQIMKVGDKVEDIELTQDELDETKKEVTELFGFAQLGGGAQPEFESVTETLMTGSNIILDELHDVISPDLTKYPDAKVLKTVIEERERYDFSIKLTRVNLDLEKKIIIDGEGIKRMVSPSTSKWGPPGYIVTWDFLVNMTILIAMYAIPMHRLAGMLSTSVHIFTGGYFSRLFRYVANRLAPIYLQLFADLANAYVLMGDDTTARVLEVMRYFRNKSETLPPWYGYRNRDTAKNTAMELDLTEEKPSLGVILAQELGFEFDKRTGSGTKVSLKTTTISGRSVTADPRSLVVIYRSHLGGLGNLLEILLENRKRVNKDLIIQSDLSTVNLISSKQLNEYFDIKYAGCASHARRTFAQYEHEDPDACSHMLHLFKGLFINERILDTYGRNSENVIAVRDKNSRGIWNDITKLAEDMKPKWSAETKLGNATRYILKHKEELMLHLKNPRLSLTNNFSEKSLRMEKLIQGSSLFRSNLEGRFSLDIVRSVLQTAVASQIPLDQYLLDILKTKPKDIEEEPEKFTPFAYRKKYFSELNNLKPPPEA